MTFIKRFPIVIAPAAVFLIIAATLPVFSQECTEVPGTRYNVPYIDRMLGEANGLLSGCSAGNSNCREADKRLDEADVAIIQILTECTSTGNCLRGGIGTITNRAGRLADLSRRLVRQSGMRRTYDNTLVTVQSWENTRRCPTVRCEQYARTAVSQNQENLRRKCGYTGTRWTSEYKGHYDWCFTAPQSLADAETNARTDALRQCKPQPDNVLRCQQYAGTAVSQNQENLRRKCGYTGARWTNEYQGHYNWCMAVQQSVADAETNARANELRQCQQQPNKGPRCQQYAGTAVSQNQENLRRNCGFTGSRWTNEYQGHYNWCMAVQQSVADAETNARANELRQCQSKSRSCPGPGMTIIYKLVNPPPYTGYSVICRDGSGKLWMQGANAAPITSIVKGKQNSQTGCYDESKVVISSRTIAGRLCKP